MKKLIKIAFFSVALLAFPIIAQDITFNNSLTVSKSNEYILIPTEKFVAPEQGIYTISFNANITNLKEHGTKVAITTHVNNAPSHATTFSIIVAKTTSPVNYTGNLVLNKGDTVDFRIISSDDQIRLNPVDESPSFKATITRLN